MATVQIAKFARFINRKGSSRDFDFNNNSALDFLTDIPFIWRRWKLELAWGHDTIGFLIWPVEWSGVKLEFDFPPTCHHPSDRIPPQRNRSSLFYLCWAGWLFKCSLSEYATNSSPLLVWECKRKPKWISFDSGPNLKKWREWRWNRIPPSELKDPHLPLQKDESGLH